jgi:hypothetical protein
MLRNAVKSGAAQKLLQHRGSGTVGFLFVTCMPISFRRAAGLSFVHLNGPVEAEAAGAIEKSAPLQPVECSRAGFLAFLAVGFEDTAKDCGAVTLVRAMSQRQVEIAP